MSSLDAGFTVAEDCYSLAECDRILDWQALSSVGTRCLLENGWCKRLAEDLRSRLSATIPEIASLVTVQCTYFNKSASQNWFVAYHQDRSIPVAPSAIAQRWPGYSQKEGMTYIQGSDELLSRLVAVRLHLDSTTSGNGALRVIPHSHCNGTLSPEQIQSLRSTACEQLLLVAKGGVVAMRPLLLHASSKSRVSSDRRILHFLFGPTSLPEGLAWQLAV